MRGYYLDELVRFGLDAESLADFSILGLYELYRVLVLKETR